MFNHTVSPVAIVLLAHGSRDPLWRQPIEAVAQAVHRQAPEAPVACAYLESCEPDLPTVCDQLHRSGVRSLRILPLFLGMGKHAREDLPALKHKLDAQYPDATFTWLPAVGEHPELIALLAQLALGSSTLITPVQHGSVSNLTTP